MKAVTTLALVLASTAAQADPTYSFDVGSHVRWFGDTSGAIVADDALAGVRMTAGRSLTRTDVRSREVDVGLFARWVYASASGTMFGNLDTAVDQHLLAGGVRAEAPLRRWFSAVAQAEAGMARTHLSVTQSDLMPVDDHRWAPYAQATLGGDLRFANSKRFRASLGVDLGYLVAVPVELHALPGDRPDEDLSISTAFAGIGKLDTRGWTYSMSLRGAF